MRLSFLLILLAGCDNISGGKDIQPELTRKALNNVPVVVTPRFGAEGVNRVCQPYQVACTRLQEINGIRYADIFAIEPKDFNDFNRTETLGHECYHAFGAMHER